MLAIVPPEAPPRIALTRSFTREQVLPYFCIACFCRKCTPRSEGIESKPQQCTMRAPEARAAPSYLRIMRRIHCTSPVRSQ